MDPTDIVVESLLKAASTEVVKRGIEAISTRLRTVFDRGNHAEIKKVIEEDNLTAPLAQLAKESLDSSFIIPFSAPNEARPRHKVDLFLYVLQFGFKLSSENKTDILLPGSIIGIENLSLFSTAKEAPTLSRDTLTISLPDPSKSGFYSIIPAADESLTMFDSYKSSVKRLRNETEDYIEAGKLIGTDFNWRYSVDKFAAGTVQFLYGSLFSPLQRSTIGMVGSQAAITSWSEGIRSMLRHAAEYPDLAVLDPDEVLNIMGLAEDLKGFATRRL